MIATETRELDTLVAEKVMGWLPLEGPSKAETERFQEQYWKMYNSYDPLNYYDIWRRKPLNHKWAGGLMYPVPHYSTHLPDAWKIVEDLNFGYSFTLLRQCSISSFGWYRWTAIFVPTLEPWGTTEKPIQDEMVYMGMDDDGSNPALAICRAALATAGVS